MTNTLATLGPFLGPFLSEEELAVLIAAAGRRQPLWTEAELECLIGWAEKVMLDQVLLELVMKGAADVIWDPVRNEPMFFPATDVRAGHACPNDG